MLLKGFAILATYLLSTISAKAGFVVPIKSNHEVVAQAKREDSYSIGLSIFAPYQFVIPVTVGTNSQVLGTVISTFNSNSWIPSIDCNTLSCSYLPQNAYNQFLGGYTGATPASPLGVVDYIYAQDSMVCQTGSSGFVVGGQPSFSANYYLVFQGANPNAEILTTYNGYIGLGSSPIVIGSVKDGLLAGDANKLFSVWFKTFGAYGPINGAIEFNNYDSGLLLSLPTFYTIEPSTNPLFVDKWAIPNWSFIYGFQNLAMNKIFEIDMGTPFIILPVADFNTLTGVTMMNLPGAPQVDLQNGALFYNVPCDFSGLRPVTIGGYVINPVDYYFGDGIRCVPMFIGYDLDIANPRYVLGNQFFRNKMAIFDLNPSTPMVGIAPLA